MELYLHVGTNKTGSSFLQTALTNSKSDLKNRGFYIPDSRWDEQMLTGNISPGNGYLLAKYLSAKDKTSAIIYFERLAIEANNRNLKKVVLSNEVLIRILSYSDELQILFQSASQAGFKNIKCLCFLRIPHKHALSLYKHRAKSGKWPEYKIWLEKDYETLRLFEEFINNYEKYNIEWKFYLYQKDSDYLLDVFYENFLQMAKPNYILKEKINKSLTLNSIAVLTFFEKIYTGLSAYLYKELSEKKLSNSNEKVLTERFNCHFKEYAQEHEGIIYTLAKLLPDRQQKNFLEKPSSNLPEHTFESLNFTLFRSEKIAVERALNLYKEDYIKRHLVVNYRKLYGLLRKVRMNTFDNEKYGGSLR